MSDWKEELAAAEAQAERFQVVESEAEKMFYLVRAEAEQSGNVQEALQSKEFEQWMNARHATDLAWGSWSLLKDGKPRG